MPRPSRRTVNEGELAMFEMLQLTFSKVGDDFFRSLVHNLCTVLKVDAAWVTEYRPNERTLRSRAFRFRDGWIDEYEYGIVGTPCEPVVERGSLVHYPDNVIKLFPGDPDLPRLGAVSYMGAPLFDSEGRLMGHLAVLDSRPMPEDKLKFSVLQTFAARAASELRRLQAEEDVHKSQEKLQRLLNTAMDAVIELDAQLNVSQANPATLKLLGAQLVGSSFPGRLGEESAQRFHHLIRELDDASPHGRSRWIPGGLVIKDAEGKNFQSECTLSRAAGRESVFYTMIVRNVEDRLEAERHIRRLTERTHYLENEIREVKGLGGILGQSPAIERMLGDIRDVATTDSTVLIEGETGTGKELVARAIHEASRRSGKTLITINCAAIPSALVESELFGHEKGAFTGALERRDGRFVLADGGTIFLDEAGELPFDVQAKLLRVLQEGEVTPVGSAHTKRVDVRVVAATNRNLRKQVEAGRFREDLFYRLNVFPIRVPPLRDRGDDVLILAEAIARRIASRLGRTVQPLSPECIGHLRTYSWPGNVRELQNVIERSLITSPDGSLNLERALSDFTPDRKGELEPLQPAGSAILTAAELRQLEKANIVRALDAAGWKVSGKHGAAELLKVKPTTLSSRIKALGIQRPK